MFMRNFQKQRKLTNKNTWTTLANTDPIWLTLNDFEQKGKQRMTSETSEEEKKKEPKNSRMLEKRSKTTLVEELHEQNELDKKAVSVANRVAKYKKGNWERAKEKPIEENKMEKNRKNHKIKMARRKEEKIQESGAREEDYIDEKVPRNHYY